MKTNSLITSSRELHNARLYLIPGPIIAYTCCVPILHSCVIGIYPHLTASRCQRDLAISHSAGTEDAWSFWCVSSLHLHHSMPCTSILIASVQHTALPTQHIHNLHLQYYALHIPTYSSTLMPILDKCTTVCCTAPHIHTYPLHCSVRYGLHIHTYSSGLCLLHIRPTAATCLCHSKLTCLIRATQTANGWLSSV